MSKNPIINALSAALYIALIVLLMTYITKKVTPASEIVAPITMLSLLTFSVAMMAYLFFFQPVQLYLSGKKKQGAKLFVQTLALFGAMTFIFLAVLYAGFSGVENKQTESTESSASVTIKGETDMIRLDSPSPEATVTSPLTITGEARGNWFFESTFPVVLTDWDGLIIAEGYAEAEGEWMTEDYVPFTATLTFEKPAYGERGSLILQKDNPSDLPEHDDALEITVYFK